MTNEDQAATPSTDAAQDGEPGGASLDQVRDILFGAQVREYEGRIKQLEERLLEEIGEMKQDVHRGIESLDVYVRQEIESLVARLSAEQGERADADKEISKELERRSAEQDKRTAKLDEKLAQAERALRQYILDQAKSLREEIQTNQKQQRKALDKEAGNLRAAKVDRTILGELLMEMALRLHDDTAAPDGD